MGPMDRIAFAFWMEGPVRPQLAVDDLVALPKPEDRGHWAIIGGQFVPTHWLDVEFPRVPPKGEEA